MEFFDANGNDDEQRYEEEDDPRYILAEKVRNFFLQAISQQHLIDSQEKKKRQSGTLYKTDGGYLKIHLQAPAGDLVFHGSNAGKQHLPEPLPEMWAFIALPPDSEEEYNFEFEEIVLAADNLILHSVVPGFEPVEIWVRDDYIGLAGSMENLADFNAQPTESELEQIESEQLLMASHWAELLEDYDLRTIVTNPKPNTGAA